MHSLLRRTLAISATALLSLTAAAGLVSIAGSASARPAGATTIPPWEPDPSSVGGLIFYNASGQVITGGNVTDQPLAAYVEGTTTVRAGDTKATLLGYLPVHGQSTGQFQGEAIGASPNYPNASAPGALATTGLPVETGGPTDESVQTLALDFPNTDTSADGYAHMYQLRLKTSGPGESLSVTYDSADIEITGSTWSVVYSQAKTSTSLSVTPASPVLHGTSVKLSATVSPSTATGQVAFKDGTKVLKSVALSAGKASYSTTTLADGTHKLTAVFEPTSGSGYGTSTSSSHSITVKARSTTTKLTASKSTITSGQSLKLSATESPSTAGSIALFNGSAKLATVKVSKGAATYSTTKLSVGTHSLKAVFTPSDTQGYASSTSKVVKVTVNK